MTLKGLLENSKITQDEIDRLKSMRLKEASARLFLVSNIIGRGGNVHGIDAAATAKRRALNKRGRATRRAQRKAKT